MKTKKQGKLKLKHFEITTIITKKIFTVFYSCFNFFATINYQDIVNITNSKYRFITDISTGTKSILVILQMLSIGGKALFAPLSHSMESIDDYRSLKHPTIPHNDHL